MAALFVVREIEISELEVLEVYGRRRVRGSVTTFQE
jgi:hypothetical protein